jgi:hypothetical protein
MAKLTSKERNKLPSKDFAEPKERKFPIEDKSHAANAKARAAQSGDAEEKAKVDRAVDKKWGAFEKAHKVDVKSHEDHQENTKGGESTLEDYRD